VFTRGSEERQSKQQNKNQKKQIGFKYCVSHIHFAQNRNRFVVFFQPLSWPSHFLCSFFFLKKIVLSLATTTRRGRGRRRGGRRRGRWSGFFFIRTRFIQANVEVFDDISASVCCNNAEEITHLVLLEETLGQILEIPLGKCNGASNLNLGLVIGDFDMISQLASLTIDFDPFLQVRR